MSVLTQEYVLKRYSYSDGKLIAKFSKGPRKVGDICGHTGDKDGYLRVSVKNKPIAVHRVVFLMHHGYLPEIIDHINGNVTDNRIENLRESTPLENMRNKKWHRNGKHYGISFHARDKKWQAYSRENGKRVYLGYFINENDAINAVKNHERN